MAINITSYLLYIVQNFDAENLNGWLLTLLNLDGGNLMDSQCLHHAPLNTVTLYYIILMG